MSDSSDLFGRPIVADLRGRQLPLFHVPVSLPAQPDRERERNLRMFPVRHTPPLFGQALVSQSPARKRR
jgi:hypothetical protein